MWAHPTGLSKISSFDRKGLAQRKKAKAGSLTLTYERGNHTRCLQVPICLQVPSLHNQVQTTEL